MTADDPRDQPERNPYDGRPPAPDEQRERPPEQPPERPPEHDRPPAPRKERRPAQREPRGRPPEEPVPPAQGTLTRLIGKRGVRYFLAALMVSTFLIVFTIMELFISGLVCLPSTLGSATDIAMQASGGGGDVTAMMKAHYISCSVATALHPFVIFVSLIISAVASLPVYRLLQSVDRGELLRAVM